MLNKGITSFQVWNTLTFGCVNSAPNHNPEWNVKRLKYFDGALIWSVIWILPNLASWTIQESKSTLLALPALAERWNCFSDRFQLYSPHQLPTVQESLGKLWVTGTKERYTWSLQTPQVQKTMIKRSLMPSSASSFLAILTLDSNPYQFYDPSQAYVRRKYSVSDIWCLAIINFPCRDTVASDTKFPDDHDRCFAKA